MTNAIIVCNGENIKTVLPKGFVIYADGGINHLPIIGLTPDCIIGDFDSAKPSLLKEYENKIVRLNEQNTTDSEKAIIFAKEKGFKDIIMTGAIGSRIDHTINNLYLLEKYSELNIHIVDKQTDIFLAKNPICLKTKKGDLISLIPLNDVTSLKMEGLQYKTNTLSRSFVGVHNIATSSKVNISFNKGTLLIALISEPVSIKRFI